MRTYRVTTVATKGTGKPASFLHRARSDWEMEELAKSYNALRNDRRMMVYRQDGTALACTPDVVVIKRRRGTGN